MRLRSPSVAFGWGCVAPPWTLCRPRLYPGGVGFQTLRQRLARDVPVVAVEDRLAVLEQHDLGRLVRDPGPLGHPVAGRARLQHPDDPEGQVLAALEMGLHVSEGLLRLVAGPRLEDRGARVLRQELVHLLRGGQEMDAVL